VEFLGRRRISGVFEDFIENKYGSIDQFINEFLRSGILEGSQMSSQNGSIDLFDSILSRSEHSEYSEMSLKSKINSEGSGFRVERSQEKKILKEFSFF